MLCPRFWASSSSAKVESPRMLMRAMGSIWTATFNFMGWSACGWLAGVSGAGVECRQQMARQMPWRNQHGVKTQLESRRMGHQPGLRRIDDARLLARRHGIGGIVECGAGLDLDKRHQIAPPRHQVDLAIGRAKTLCENA